MKKQWNTVLIIALILIVVLFSVLNVDPVNINFGFTTVAIPLVVVIIGTLLIGVLIAVIWSTSIVYRERNKQKKLQKKIDTFEADTKKEQERVKEDHQKETQMLKDENKELKRRISNMKQGQTVKGKKDGIE